MLHGTPFHKGCLYGLNFFDFVLEFSEFREFEGLSRWNVNLLMIVLIILEKRGKIHFENKIVKLSFL